jgi:hypothetical protein
LASQSPQSLPLDEPQSQYSCSGDSCTRLFVYGRFVLAEKPAFANHPQYRLRTRSSVLAFGTTVAGLRFYCNPTFTLNFTRIAGYIYCFTRCGAVRCRIPSGRGSTKADYAGLSGDTAAGYNSANVRGVTGDSSFSRADGLPCRRSRDQKFVDRAIVMVITPSPLLRKTRAGRLASASAIRFSCHKSYIRCVSATYSSS